MAGNSSENQSYQPIYRPWTRILLLSKCSATVSQEGHQKGLSELLLWSRRDLGGARFGDTDYVVAQSWMELNPITIASLRAGESVIPKLQNLPFTN